MQGNLVRTYVLAKCMESGRWKVFCQLRDKKTSRKSTRYFPAKL